jgi:hypothetical protein
MKHDYGAQRYETQDPKYCIQDNKLVNVSTGEPIPKDEPTFLLRAKDTRAYPAILGYAERCEHPLHRWIVLQRAYAFCDYAMRNLGRMKEPDTAGTDVQPTQSICSNS